MVNQVNKLPTIPTVNDLQAFMVNRPGWEGIVQDLYDFQSYPAAGTTQLTFFALPIGQGGKTESDTNLDLAGQLPTNQMFLVKSIEVYFYPSTPTVAADMPAAFGAKAVAALINDAYIFYRSGNLQFLIGSKDYLRSAPLNKFPPKTNFCVEGAAADSTTAAADSQTRIVYGRAVGRPYFLKDAALLLESNQNFNVRLNWPEGVQAITNPARVGVTLDGVLYRRSQ